MGPTQEITPSSLGESKDRRVIKEDYVIMKRSDGKLSLKYLVLYSDMIVCYRCKKQCLQTTSTLMVKWFCPLSQLCVRTEPPLPKIPLSSTNSRSFRSQVVALCSTMKDPMGSKELLKKRKKLTLMAQQLKVVTADLPLTLVTFPKNPCKAETFSFLLSSEFERTLWVHLIHETKQNKIRRGWTFEMDVAVEKLLKTRLVKEVALETDVSAPVIVGKLMIVIHSLSGLVKAGDYYVVIETDCYGEFSHVARTKMIVNTIEPHWQQQLRVRLQGSKHLRFLIYEEFQDSQIFQGSCQLLLTPQLIASRLRLHQVDPRFMVIISLDNCFLYLTYTFSKIPFVNTS